MCVYVANIVKNCIRSNIIQKVPANTLLTQLGVELLLFPVCLVLNVCYITAWAMPKVTLHKILVGEYNIDCSWTICPSTSLNSIIVLLILYIFIFLLYYYFLQLYFASFRITKVWIFLGISCKDCLKVLDSFFLKGYLWMYPTF